MNARILLGFFASALLLVYLGHAQEPTPLAVETDLVSMLVDSALELAEQDDPLRRAQSCKTLAHKLGDSLKAAARRRDSERSVALSEMLQLVMIEGVAETLNQARAEAPADSPKLLEVKNVTAQITAVAGQTENSLLSDDDAPGEFQGLMKDIQSKIKQAKVGVEHRSQGKGKGPPPHVAKKKKK